LQLLAVVLWVWLQKRGVDKLEARLDDRWSGLEARLDRMHSDMTGRFDRIQSDMARFL
jgi:hypothetical protein